MPCPCVVGLARSFCSSADTGMEPAGHVQVPSVATLPSTMEAREGETKMWSEINVYGLTIECGRSHFLDGVRGCGDGWVSRRTEPRMQGARHALR